MLVATSIYLVNILQGESECWTDQLKYHTGYSESDLEDCAAELRTLIADAPREPACALRYSLNSNGHSKSDSVMRIEIVRVIARPPFLLLRFTVGCDAYSQQVQESFLPFMPTSASCCSLSALLRLNRIQVSHANHGRGESACWLRACPVGS